MKNIFKFFTLLGLLSLTSCNDDFLEQQSPDQLNSSNFWRNKTAAEAGLSATYAFLEGSVEEYAFSEVKWPVEAYREDICKLGSDALNYQNWVELADFTYTNGNSQFTSYWTLNYRGISNANLVITKVGQMPSSAITDVDKNQIIAEAQFL